MPVSIHFFEGLVLGKCGRVLSKAELDHEQVCFLHGLVPHNVKSHQRLNLYRAGATSPVGQVSTGPLFSPSALTADIGEYDVPRSIDEQSTGSTELAA